MDTSSFEGYWRAYNQFDSIPRIGYHSISHNIHPYCSPYTHSCNNLPPLYLCENLGINYTSHELVIGMAWVMALPPQSSLTPGELSSDTGTGIVIWATRFAWEARYAAWVLSCKFNINKSKSEETDCLWLCSAAMPFQEPYIKVVGSLLVTRGSFTVALCAIDHPSATMLLPNSLTANCFISSHSSSRFMHLSIIYLTAIDLPRILTDWFPSAFDKPFIFHLYVFPLYSWSLSLIVAHTWTRHTCFLSCWWLQLRCLPNM